MYTVSTSLNNYLHGFNHIVKKRLENLPLYLNDWTIRVVRELFETRHCVLTNFNFSFQEIKILNWISGTTTVENGWNLQIIL